MRKFAFLVAKFQDHTRSVKNPLKRMTFFSHQRAHKALQKFHQQTMELFENFSHLEFLVFSFAYFAILD
jgi:hypothetical protein